MQSHHLPELSLFLNQTRQIMLSHLLKSFVCSVLIATLAACGGSTPDTSSTNSNNAAGNSVQAMAANYVQPRTGWFWNPAEGGRGFAIERQGSQLFVAGFMYETTGESTWYVSTMNQQPDGSYRGDFLRYTGGQSLLGTYKQAQPTTYATATASFDSSTTGQLSVTSSGSNATTVIALQAFPISTPTAFQPSTDQFQSGWWWNPDESGRGFFIEAQGAQAFIGSFMYQDNGLPTWYVSSAKLLAPNLISGTLESYSNGQSMFGGYKPASLSPSGPGVVSFEMTSNTTGVMTLTNGNKINVQRFVFNTEPVAAETAKNLLISEVSSDYYSNGSTWFEVYNPNATTSINLADYTLRSTYLDQGSIYSTPTTFPMPSVTIPPKSYLVVSSRTVDNPVDSKQIVYVGNSAQKPFWTSSGFLELIKGGQTADVVRFGNNNASPTTASAWTGANAPALPFDKNQYGYSIVRLAASGMTDTNTGSDWSSVNFATPAGPNDVGVGVVDSDGDGIPDSAKINGKTFAGLDLYAMGARPGQRDVFMQIDSMNSNDPGIILRPEAAQKLVDTFANKVYSAGKKKIALHIDAGNLFSPTINPGAFNLGGGKSVPYTPCLVMEYDKVTTSGCTNLYDVKRTNLDVRRKLIFHYVIMGQSQQVDGSCGSSGLGEVNGNDFIITLGNCGFKTTAGTQVTYLINAQAATLMHEFGHNLGLSHGGNESNNYKPNYYSIMNYMYSFPGLSANPSSTQAANRFYLTNKTYAKATGLNICNIDNSPCGNSFIMDYSNGSSIDLDENNLNESLNIGRGAVAGAYADWDNSNSQTSGTFAFNIHNPDTTTSLRVLKDYNDWDNLVLPLARTFQGVNSGAVLPTMQPVKEIVRKDTMSDRPRNLVYEDPNLLPRHLDSIRRTQH